MSIVFEAPWQYASHPFHRIKNLILDKYLKIEFFLSEKKAVKSRKAAFSSGWKASGSLPPGWMRNKFRDIVQQEVELLWQKKKDTLEARYKQRKEEDEHGDMHKD